MTRIRNGLLATFAVCLSADAFAPSSTLPLGTGKQRRLHVGGGEGMAPPFTTIAMSSVNKSPEQESNTGTDSEALSGEHSELSAPRSVGGLSPLLSVLFGGGKRTSPGGPPPLQIEDGNLLFYDVFLLLNLSVSISFWVVHRMSFVHVLSAFSEGSLLCILWIAAGLANGAFLNSAVDGHYDPRSEEGKGGPKAAGLLGLSTFVSTCSLRIIIALVSAVLQHRPVGAIDGEMLIPMEMAAGLVLMSVWRALHSSYTPRI